MTSAELVELISYVCEQWKETSDTCSILDNALGDGDHGVSIYTGTQAVLAKIEDYKEGRPADVLKNVARDFLSAVGASIGPLYATGLIRMAQAVNNREQLELEDVPVLFSAFVNGLSDRGKARIGEKTMMDVWLPALSAFQASVQGANSLAKEALLKGCEEAIRAGNAGLLATKDMVAAKGRASRLGNRSVGFIDPGAYSALQLLRFVMERCSGSNFAGMMVELDA